ncbi:unnamed protein product, partial [Effrenium voratum]
SSAWRGRHGAEFRVAASLGPAGGLAFQTAAGGPAGAEPLPQREHVAKGRGTPGGPASHGGRGVGERVSERLRPSVAEGGELAAERARPAAGADACELHGGDEVREPVEGLELGPATPLQRAGEGCLHLQRGPQRPGEARALAAGAGAAVGTELRKSAAGRGDVERGHQRLRQGAAVVAGAGPVEDHGEARFDLLQLRAQRRGTWRLASGCCPPGGPLEAAHLTPDLVTFHAAVTCCGRGAAWRQALWFFGRIRRPEPTSFNSAISACEQAMQWQRALGLLQQGVQAKQVDVVSYSAAMSSCEKASVWQHALLLLDLVTQPETRLRPDAILFTAALGACAGAAAWRQALHWLPPALAASLGSGDCGPLGVVLMACGRQAAWRSAAAAVALGKDAGLQPDLPTCNTFLSVFSAASAWRDALVSLQHVARSKLRPSTVTRNAAAAACAGSGGWRRVAGLLENSRSRVGCNVAAEALRVAKRWRQALHLAARSEVSDVKTCDAAICACEAGSHRGVQMLMGELDRHHLPALLRRLRGAGTQLRAAWVLRDWQHGLELFAELRRAQSELDVVAGNAQLAAARGGGWRLAVDLRAFRARSLEPSVVSYNTLGAAEVAGGRWHRALARLATATRLDAFNLSSCAGKSPWRRAVCLLRSAERRRLALRVVRNAALAAISAASEETEGAWRQALRLGAQALGDVDGADGVTGNSALSACERARRWRQAMELLRNVRRRRFGNIISCNAAMSACQKVARWQDAVLMLVGIQPTAISYSTAASACEGPMWPRALRCFSASPRAALNAAVVAAGGAADAAAWRLALQLAFAAPCAGCAADLVTYNAALSALSGNDNTAWRAAVGLGGLRPDGISRSARISATQSWREAAALYASSGAEAAGAGGADAKKFACGAAVSTCEAFGAWRAALALLTSATGGSGAGGAAGSLVAGNSALSACQKAMAWQEALALLRGFADLKLRADVISYNAVVSACQGEWRQALRLLEELQSVHLSPGVVTYNAMITACEKRGWRKALASLHQMELKSVQPDAFSTSASVNACGLSAAWRAALAATRAAGPSPPLAARTACAGALGARRMWRRALGLKEGVASARLGNSLLLACSGALQWRQALAIGADEEDPSELGTLAATARALAAGGAGELQQSLAELQGLAAALLVTSLPPVVKMFQDGIEGYQMRAGDKLMLRESCNEARAAGRCPPQTATSYTEISRPSPDPAQGQGGTYVFEQLNRAACPANHTQGPCLVARMCYCAAASSSHSCATDADFSVDAGEVHFYGAPGVVEGLVVLQEDFESFTLRWDYPADDGGGAVARRATGAMGKSPVTHYNLFFRLCPGGNYSDGVESEYIVPVMPGKWIGGEKQRPGENMWGVALNATYHFREPVVDAIAVPIIAAAWHWSNERIEATRYCMVILATNDAATGLRAAATELLDPQSSFVWTTDVYPPKDRQIAHSRLQAKWSLRRQDLSYPNAPLYVVKERSADGSVCECVTVWGPKDVPMTPLQPVVATADCRDLPSAPLVKMGGSQKEVANTVPQYLSQDCLVQNYDIQPPLPKQKFRGDPLKCELFLERAGLSLDSWTGVISGTPTALQPRPEIYLVTATNSGEALGGKTSAYISLAIIGQWRNATISTCLSAPMAGDLVLTFRNRGTPSAAEAPWIQAASNPQLLRLRLLRPLLLALLRSTGEALGSVPKGSPIGCGALVLDTASDAARGFPPPGLCYWQDSQDLSLGEGAVGARLYLLRPGRRPTFQGGATFEGGFYYQLVFKEAHAAEQSADSDVFGAWAPVDQVPQLRPQVAARRALLSTPPRNSPWLTGRPEYHAGFSNPLLGEVPAGQVYPEGFPAPGARTCVNFSSFCATSPHQYVNTPESTMWYQDTDAEEGLFPFFAIFEGNAALLESIQPEMAFNPFGTASLTAVNSFALQTDRYLTNRLNFQLEFSLSPDISGALTLERSVTACPSSPLRAPFLSFGPVCSVLTGPSFVVCSCESSLPSDHPLVRCDKLRIQVNSGGDLRASITATLRLFAAQDWWPGYQPVQWYVQLQSEHGGIFSFKKVPNAGFTVWQDLLLVQTTPELCADECLQRRGGGGFFCNSFKFHRFDEDCYLSSYLETTASPLRLDWPGNVFDYYEYQDQVAYAVATTALVFSGVFFSSLRLEADTYLQPPGPSAPPFDVPHFFPSYVDQPWLRLSLQLTLAIPVHGQRSWASVDFIPPSGFLGVSLAAEPTVPTAQGRGYCGRGQVCRWMLTVGQALWPDVAYSFALTVKNPPEPRLRESWTVQVSSPGFLEGGVSHSSAAVALQHPLPVDARLLGCSAHFNDPAFEPSLGAANAGVFSARVSMLDLFMRGVVETQVFKGEMMHFRLLLPVVLAQVSRAHDDNQCCPGLVFQKDSCNTCVCGPNGLKDESACTLRLCKEEEDSGRCVPLTAFPKGDGLNTCACPASGRKDLAECTWMKCPPPFEAASPERASAGAGFWPHQGTCCPGHAFEAADGASAPPGRRIHEAMRVSFPELRASCPKICSVVWSVQSFGETESVFTEAGDGLNTCTCPQSGIKADASCTSFECPKEVGPELSGTCCPGLLFTAPDGCNTCRCATSGMKNASHCTRMACPLQATPQGWCAPFSVFPKGDGLNSCTCSSSGSKDQAQCTELACPKVVLPPGANPRPVEEGACCPGRSFTAADGCNTCRCAGSGLKNESVCTRMACPPWMAITENCTAFSTYPAGDGLNTCVCPADGKKSEEFCTSLKCPEPKEEEEDRCCPGVSFPASDGCNTCVCPGSGLMSEAACTLMACPPRPTILPPGRCTPFVAFPKGDGTNTCTCPASGLSSEARCTHLPCQAPPGVARAESVALSRWRGVALFVGPGRPLNAYDFGMEGS